MNKYKQKIRQISKYATGRLIYVIAYIYAGKDDDVVWEKACREKESLTHTQSISAQLVSNKKKVHR